MREDNKTVCQEYFYAVGGDDLEGIESRVTEDFVHELMGSSVFSGRLTCYEVLKLVKDLRVATASGVEFKFDELTDEENRVCVIVHGRLGRVSGGRFDGLYVIFCHRRDEKIALMRELTDTKYTDSIMGNVTGPTSN